MRNPRGAGRWLVAVRVLVARGNRGRSDSAATRREVPRSAVDPGNYPHDPIAMEGGTTFHFITEGFDVAFGHAEAAAGDLGVDIAGGASTVRQAFAAGVIDELMLDVVPVLLGAGERLFDGVQYPGLQPVEVIHSPRATHVRYGIGR